MSDNLIALNVVLEPVVADWDNSYIRGIVRGRVRESIALKQRLLANQLIDTVGQLAEVIVHSLRNGGKVVLFGNGGSAADATHLAAEFVGRFILERDPMPAISLSDNVSAMTAIGNDYAYELTFARQIRAFGSAGDVAIALSTSGASPNVLKAVRVAKEQSMFTAAFVGAKGIEMAKLADLSVVIPSVDTARIQEGYMLYAHIMCEVVEHEMFGRDLSRALP